MQIIPRHLLCVLVLVAFTSFANAALVHQWNLDEGSGTVLTSQVGGIAPTLHGDAFWETAGPPTTYLPDGTLVTSTSHLQLGGHASDYVDFGNNTSLAPSNLSVAFWAKGDPRDDFLDTVLFSKHGDSELASSWEFGFSNKAPSREGFFKVWIDGTCYSANEPTRFTIEDFADGDWHHFVGTYNGSEISFLVDGKEISTIPASGSVDQTSDPLFLGQRPYLGHANRDQWAARFEAGGPILIFDHGLSGAEAAALGSFQYQPIDPLYSAGAATGGAVGS